MIVTTYISLVVTMLFWGGTFIAGRILAGSVSPASAAFVRFVIATLALAVLTRMIHGRIPIPSRRQWLSLLLLGMTGIVSYNILFFIGMQNIEAGRASLIIALNPLAITVAAAIFLDEKLSFMQFGGILISLTGALFVISNGHPWSIFSGGFGIGEASILGCVASWTAYSLIGRNVLKTLSPLVSIFYSSLIGTLLLFPFALNNNLTTNILTYSIYDWASLTFLGLLGTAVGVSFYYRAIQKIGASRSSVFINLVPFFSILLSWLMLGEAMKFSVLSGGLLLLTGVVVLFIQPDFVQI